MSDPRTDQEAGARDVTLHTADGLELGVKKAHFGHQTVFEGHVREVREGEGAQVQPAPAEIEVTHFGLWQSKPGGAAALEGHPCGLHALSLHVRQIAAHELGVGELELIELGACEIDLRQPYLSQLYSVDMLARQIKVS